MKYNHNHVEKKCAQHWTATKAHDFINQPQKPKYFILDMFPYPSGKGIHVGHIKGYAATDAVARYKLARGFNVLHPIGYDAFGLPAEQFAIKTGEHPQTFTAQNIANFRRQLQAMGFYYHPNLEINTTDPAYYLYTQQIFGWLFTHGLAELKETQVNWCAQLGTVLANEEVLTAPDGRKISERGGFLVTKKRTKQWMLKITAYADKLLAGLNEIAWNDSVKRLQTDWIGKSEGANIQFVVQDHPELVLTAFTTRPDTLFGATFVAIAPEHPQIKQLCAPERWNEIAAYIETISARDEVERKNKATKSGCDLGIKVINPATNKPIPLWVAEHVLATYGTGVVMGTPAHDERDYAFALAHDLPIVPVIAVPSTHKLPYVEDGKHINSEFLNGLTNAEAITTMTDWLTKHNLGQKHTTYKLRDWVFSRQRYWGEPFPILYDENNRAHLDNNLPVVLPAMTDYRPNPDGLPPLANATQWMHPVINGHQYTRDPNTMPQWAGSSWYYLAYLMKIGRDDGYWPLTSNEAKALFDRFLPVDLYVGGQEHSVLHLLYARFWHRFLYDIKVVSHPEPFMHLINQGMILNEDGTKMSKSKGTIVGPDEICASHGADALRLYECFMGPVTASLAWSPAGLDGARKWLERVWQLFATAKKIDVAESPDPELKKAYHAFLKRVNTLMNNVELNVAISELMIFVNAAYKADGIPTAYLATFALALSWFCPFLGAELRSQLNCAEPLLDASFPDHDENVLVTTTMVISCMVNGKFRAAHEFAITCQQDEIIATFLADPRVQRFIADKPIKKTIYIPQKAVSILL